MSSKKMSEIARKSAHTLLSTKVMISIVLVLTIVMGALSYLPIYTPAIGEEERCWTCTTSSTTSCTTSSTCTETDCTETVTDCTATTTVTDWSTTTEISTSTLFTCTEPLITTTVTTTSTETFTDCTETVADCIPGTTGISLFGTIRCEGPNVIVGGTSEVDLWRKPVGTKYAFFIDATGATLLMGLCDDGSLYWDIDSYVVDQTTGMSLASGHEIMSGGPVVNGPVKYYEGSKIAPLYYKPVSGKATFWTTQGTAGTGDDAQVSGAELSFTELSIHKDMFMVELFQKPGTDPAEYAMIIYGVEGRGTLAGAVWFYTVVIPDLYSYTEDYYVVKWTDTNNNGHPDLPTTDAYVVVASGSLP